MGDAYHYPPELLELLVETIPRLVRSKKALLDFFRGAGAGLTVIGDIETRLNSDRNSISKFEIARTVMVRLNQSGDRELRTRREIIKRVSEYDDFNSCYDNDRLAAEGLVARVRQVVDKKDSFTRMRLEREEERSQRLREQQARQKALEEAQSELAAVHRDLRALYGETNPHKRGKALELVLNRLFAVAGIAVRDAFTLVGEQGEGIVEQVDGVVELDGELYLVEMKWWSEPLGPDTVAQHLVRVFNRGEARGVFIAANGFTESAIKQVKDALQHRVVYVCDLRRIVLLLERGGDLAAYFRRKTEAAILDRNVQYEP